MPDRAPLRESRTRANQGTRTRITTHAAGVFTCNPIFNFYLTTHSICDFRPFQAQKINRLHDQQPPPLHPTMSFLTTAARSASLVVARLHISARSTKGPTNALGASETSMPSVAVHRKRRERLRQRVANNSRSADSRRAMAAILVMSA